ncbi:MFS transporter (plasmid) [Deinococcus sp. KNUC1210]|uniref:MFS transporter n=1 Tax=Deinococcus sp. KNUC1210 TaxID=2917691 RepID=UPI001EF0DADB|nr:MFS transporter [Deinococcus sp. KNUC1210]ULH17174.1 MFS transporter [Deinococcus sp. KNUC1210]
MNDDSAAVTVSTPRQRTLYAVMNLGMTIPAQTGASFLLAFYVDYKKLDPTLAATALTIFTVYNALKNPVFGFLSDRTRSRWGRRIPYIRFGTLPLLITFTLLFMAPFDGRTQPGALLAYLTVVWVLWESGSAAVSTGYLGLLPEMFQSYRERTDVALRMNLVQTVGLLIALALPPLLSQLLGWGTMAGLFAVISGVSIWIGFRGLYERPESQQALALPLLAALRATFGNRSFLTVVAAQTMRFIATGTLAAGMFFFTTYSLGIRSGGLTSVLLGSAFVTAGLALWPWQRFIASRFDARTTLMLAFGLTALAVVPLHFVSSLPAVIATTMLIGVGLAGMILMGDVILSDVIDEDELNTGQRREGMYFGMSGLITTLGSALIALCFGWVSRTYGYDPKLSVQPASVGEGFRVFMTAPPIIGAGLALVLLAFYPLHGARLREVRLAAAQKRAARDTPPTP